METLLLNGVSHLSSVRVQVECRCFFFPAAARGGNDFVRAMLEWILEIIAGVILEAFFDFAVEFLGSLVLRSLAEVLDASEFGNPLLACAGYAFLGAMVGAFSLLPFPHPLVHRSRIPGVSLIVAPVLAGLGMSFVGRLRRERNQKTIPIESFACGFAFALGMALVRFFFTSKAA